MKTNFQFNFQQKPQWQRFLIYAGALVVTAMLFWIGLIFVFAFAFLALALAVVNKIKMKITGRPLFAGPQHFHRYQSQFTKDRGVEGDVIEGEVVHPKDKDETK